MRGGEMAALREVPFAQYYGSVDATPLFVLLAGLYVERTGDEETLAELWPRSKRRWAGSTDQAIRWDGFVEYRRASEQGLANQGGRTPTTRSSTQTVVSPRVTSRSPKCRLCICRQATGGTLRGAPREKRMARKLDAEAKLLAERFEEAFWCDDLGTYALALDGAKEQCRVRTSNAGQLLFSGMLREDRARMVAADLMGPRFFSGWGIRTWRSARRATIRCPTTMARSGRTTTR